MPNIASADCEAGLYSTLDGARTLFFGSFKLDHLRRATQQSCQNADECARYN